MRARFGEGGRGALCCVNLRESGLRDWRINWVCAEWVSGGRCRGNAHAVGLLDTGDSERVDWWAAGADYITGSSREIKVYNHPELEFVPTLEGRLVGIPARGKKLTPAAVPAPSPMAFKGGIHADARAFVELSTRLVNKAELLVLGGLVPNKEAAIDIVLARGFDAMKDEITAALRDHLATSDAKAG